LSTNYNAFKALCSTDNIHKENSHHVFKHYHIQVSSTYQYVEIISRQLWAQSMLKPISCPNFQLR